jgi:hypothetical protein
MEMCRINFFFMLRCISNTHYAAHKSKNNCNFQVLRNFVRGWVWWGMPVILATQELEIRKPTVLGQLRQKTP